MFRKRLETSLWVSRSAMDGEAQASQGCAARSVFWRLCSKGCSPKHETRGEPQKARPQPRHLRPSKAKGYRSKSMTNRDER